MHSISGNEEPNDHILDDDCIVDDDGESELSEDPEDVEFPATQIPKPAGEPGRPNSGGYSLEDSLAPWGREELVKVMVRTKKISNNRAVLELISNVDIHEENGRPETRSQEEVQQTRLQASWLIMWHSEPSLSMHISIHETPQLARNYPIVDKYEDRWPVRAILKMHLKATSEIYRRGAGPQHRK